MINTKKQNFVAKINNLTEERRVELIRTRVQEEFPHFYDEIANLRNAVAFLFDFFANEFPYAELDKKFIEYNKKVEQIKENVKEELQ